MAEFEPFALGGLLAFIAVLHSGPAFSADPDREARERYETAVKLYEEGAYDAAVVELNRAAELRPSYKIYYNIGQVRVAMHDYAAAIDAYRQYLDKGGDKIPGARRDQVQKEVNTLAQRVAKLSIETDVPGAEVFVDDVLIGTTPLAAPVVVNSGIRRIAVRHPDYLPQSRRLNVAGGVQEKMTFALVNGAGAATEPAPVPAAAGSGAPGTAGGAPGPATPVTSATTTRSAAAAEPVREEASPHATSHRAPWLGWALTGALAAGAAVTGGLALSKNSSLKDDRNHLDVSASDLDSKASSVRALAAVSDSLAVAALVAGGVSLWLTFGPSSQDSEQPGAQKKTAAKALRIGVGLTGVSMKAAF